MLGYNEINDLIEVVHDKIREKILYFNRMGELEEYLNVIGMDNILSFRQGFETFKNGKIVILGASNVSITALKSVVAELGLDKARFEFNLDYNKLKNYNFKKLKYNANYRVILVGPMPHSTSGKGKSNSAIEYMLNRPNYPRVEKLQSSNELKVTKSSFKEILETLIEEDYI